MARKKVPLYIEDVIEPAPIRSKSFADVFPEQAAMWLTKKNCGYKAYDFSYGSSVRAWFKCPGGKDHIFQISLSVMARAIKLGTTGCGFCRGLRPSVTNNLADLRPHLVKEWSKKNKFGPHEISYGSGKIVWWKCKKGHEWRAPISNRSTLDTGCHICEVGAPTDLSDYPEVLADFDHRKNKGIDPHALPVGVKVFWKCATNSDHKWKSGFYRTTKQTRCPFCVNKKGSKGNNLKESHPDFAKQWHPTKNKNMKATDVTSGSQYNAWWKCKKGPDHEWQVKITDRVRDNTRCPYCCFRRTSITNVLTTVAPEIAKEWHPTKNGKAKPSTERCHSRTPRWWKCSKCSNVWQAEPHRRVARGSGCQKCALLSGIKNMLKVRGIKPAKDIKLRVHKCRKTS